jgi:hypothetical protein
MRLGRVKAFLFRNKNTKCLHFLTHSYAFGKCFYFKMTWFMKGNMFGKKGIDAKFDVSPNDPHKFPL